MSPSKENALEALKRIRSLDDHGELPTEDAKYLSEFLAAAVKRLPSQEALDRDKSRNRCKKLTV